MDPTLISPEEQIAFLRNIPAVGSNFPTLEKVVAGAQPVLVPYGIPYYLYGDIARRRFSEFHFTNPEFSKTAWQKTLSFVSQPETSMRWEHITLQQPTRENLADGVTFGALMFLCYLKTVPGYIELGIPGIRTHYQLIPNITVLGFGNPRLFLGASTEKDMRASASLQVPCCVG